MPLRATHPAAERSRCARTPRSRQRREGARGTPSAGPERAAAAGEPREPLLRGGSLALALEERQDGAERERLTLDHEARRRARLGERASREVAPVEGATRVPVGPHRRRDAKVEASRLTPPPSPRG